MCEKEVHVHSKITEGSTAKLSGKTRIKRHDKAGKTRIAEVKIAAKRSSKRAHKARHDAVGGSWQSVIGLEFGEDIGAVLLDAEHAARLQHTERLRDVLVEVPVMLSVVAIVKRTRGWYEGKTA